MNSLNLQTIVPILQQNGVAFAGVFGSRARGEERLDSDLDMLIRFEKDDKTLLDLVGLENELSDTLNMKVDLVIQDSLSPYIKDTVYRDLRVLYGTR